jgi:hypothetical protein
MRTGGCQCGAVRFEVELDPVRGYACHCLECQKQSASAFAISVPAPVTSLRVTGATAVYKRKTDSGAETACHFCTACGTRLYHQSDRSPDSVTIKGGALDDAAAIELVGHIWLKRKLPWVTIDPALRIFETQPADLKAWRALLSR